MVLSIITAETLITIAKRAKGNVINHKTLDGELSVEGGSWVQMIPKASRLHGSNFFIPSSFFIKSSESVRKKEHQGRITEMKRAIIGKLLPSTGWEGNRTCPVIQVCIYAASFILPHQLYWLVLRHA